jgi:hypothetical protein
MSSAGDILIQTCLSENQHVILQHCQFVSFADQFTERNESKVERRIKTNKIF